MPRFLTEKEFWAHRDKTASMTEQDYMDWYELQEYLKQEALRRAWAPWYRRAWWLVCAWFGGKER